jgi:hypothetical protein
MFFMSGDINITGEKRKTEKISTKYRINQKHQHDEDEEEKSAMNAYHRC